MKRFRHALCLSFIALVLSGTAHAKDKDGGYSSYGQISCGKYLDAYSKTTLKGKAEYTGAHESWGAFGFIEGFITGYNHTALNGKANILVSMSMNDARRWIASWCRDNPSKNLANGIGGLILKLEK